MHLFGAIIISDFLVECANKIAQFSFNRRLIGHLFANAVSRSVQNLPQQGGVATQSN